jgi:hypothetical protein
MGTSFEAFLWQKASLNDRAAHNPSNSLDFAK